MLRCSLSSALAGLRAKDLDASEIAARVLLPAVGRDSAFRKRQAVKVGANFSIGTIFYDAQAIIDLVRETGGTRTSRPSAIAKSKDRSIAPSIASGTWSNATTASSNTSEG